MRPFNCPKTDREWAEANEYLDTVVVPKVLSTTSIEKKNQVLCNEIHSYFAGKYGTRKVKSSCMNRRYKKRGTLCTSTECLRAERNKLWNDLRRAKKHGPDTEYIKSLSAKFHQLLR